MILKTQQFKEVCTVIKNAIDNKTKTLYDETLELIASGSELKMNVTNREYFVTTTLSLDEQISSEFRAAVKAQLFLSLISKITSDTIELIIKDQLVVVKGNGEYKLPICYNNGSMITLPQIELGNKIIEMDISNDILQSINKFNSKELQRGTIVRDVQNYYYVDNHGCITFTSGACVNTFELAQEVKMLLSQKVVSLFKLFKSDAVKFYMGRYEVPNEVPQTRIKFVSDNITLTAILPTNANLINEVPVSVIRSKAEKEFNYSLEVGREDLIGVLNRLTLFNVEKNYGRFTFGKNFISVRDWSSENSESLETLTSDDRIEPSYEAIFNMNNLNLILNGCDDDKVVIKFGDHTAVAIKKGSVTDIIPELHES